MRNVAAEDVRYFLKNTLLWMKKRENSHDMITESFRRDFKKVAAKYGFSPAA